ncbi:FecCD family ABC transporter permease [Stigmatella aurantiaca]|uniref:Hemin ABC transporter permease protein n=1 Tax=Stigmatella aurantiaca (strain DW4/3-1) TaxID=378806 RepID=Q09A79_STIAD|nr:iron ABC transporter permease [Stigmatella aurantiaca]ADO75069.1 Hemin ABC transporter, permease protein [Stigmatella aurantiaca DW4/3-1]EAU68641.1 hemin ABC transporter permease protein [Stigmatella aurantiaca DW4/3-1]
MTPSGAVPAGVRWRLGRLAPGAAWPWGVLLVLLLGVSLASLAVGAVSVPPKALLGALLETLGSEAGHQLEPVQQSVILHIRLPRLLLGSLVGALLAVSGAALQALFRNPIVEPGLLGTSTGAALGAVTAIVFDAVLAHHLGALHRVAIPASAFVGALGATLLAYKLGMATGRADTTRVLLAGIAINAGAGAGVSLLTHIATDAQLRSITFWNLGSLSGASWETVRVAMLPLLLGLVLLLREAQALNLLLLGEREAQHLGVNVERLKRRLILAAALGVGASVACVGIIGFVGLLVPSLLRLVMGPDNRRLLGASALLGASLLMAADLMARSMAAPAELPIGALTSALGTPAFVLLLARGKERT